MGRCSSISLVPALFAAFSAVFVVSCESKFDVVVEPTPVKIITEVPGYGPKIQDGDLATIEYRVTLPNGKEILNDDEFKFFVDSKRPTVIKGLNDSVIGMRVGGSRSVDCPPHLHWGRIGTGNGSVPANTNLFIHIKVLDTQRQ